MTKRKRFVRDDDGHWYLIDANKEQAFEQWVAYMNESGPETEEDFEADMISGSPSQITFLDPKED